MFDSHRRQRHFYILTARIAGVVMLALTLAVSVLSQDDPKVSEAVELFNQGQDAHQARNYAQAVSLYDKALESFPEFPEAELQKGNALVSMGKIAEGEGSFRRALALREDWSLAMAGLGSVLVRESRFDEAESVLSKAVELDGQNFPALAAMADLLQKNGSDRARKLALLDKIRLLTVKANPNAGLLAAQGSLEFAVGDNKAAKSSLERALEIEPGYVNADLDLAAIALAENDTDRAEGLLASIKKRTGDTDDTKYLEARILAARGENTKALAIIDAISPEGKKMLSDFRAGLVAASAADPAELEKVLASDPKNVNALTRLCTLTRSSDPLKALDYCRRASEADPTNIGPALGFGAALVQAKRFAEAAQLFTRLMPHAPGNASLRANLATALFEMKNYNAAAEQFEWLIDHKAGVPVAYYFLAIAYDQLRKYADAMANYQSFLKNADPVLHKLEIEKVNLRLPALDKLLKGTKR